MKKVNETPAEKEITEEKKTNKFVFFLKRFEPAAIILLGLLIMASILFYGYLIINNGNLNKDPQSMQNAPVFTPIPRETPISEVIINDAVYEITSHDTPEGEVTCIWVKERQIGGLSCNWPEESSR